MEPWSCIQGPLLRRGDHLQPPSRYRVITLGSKGHLYVPHVSSTGLNWKTEMWLLAGLGPSKAV